MFPLGAVYVAMPTHREAVGSIPAKDFFTNNCLISNYLIADGTSEGNLECKHLQIRVSLRQMKD